jgi:hypothetical protein
MALARTFRTSAFGGGSGSITSPSFTPSNGSLLVVMGCLQVQSSPGWPFTNMTITDSAGLTWTARTGWQPSTPEFGEFWLNVRIWTAPVTTGVSMTVTVGTSAGNINSRFVAIIDYTDYDTGSPTGATAAADLVDDGAASLTLSGAPATTSEIFAALVHGYAAASGTAGATAGAGYTEIVEMDDGSPNWNGHMELMARDPGSTSTTFSWTDVQSGTGDMYDTIGVALEIKQAAGGPTNVAIPAEVAIPFTFPAPSISIAVPVPIPASLDVVFSMPTPAIAASANVSPSPIDIPFTMPTPGISATAVVAPSPVDVPFTFPAPVVVQTVAVPVPAAIDVPFTFPTPTLTDAVTVSPSPVDIPVTFPTPGVDTGGTPISVPASLDIPFTMPAPGISGSAAVAVPAPIAIPFTFDTPNITTDRTVSPSPIDIPFTMPTPGIAASAVVTPSPLDVVVTIPDPTIAGSASIPVPAPVAIPFTFPTPGLTDNPPPPDLVPPLTVLSPGTTLEVDPASTEITVDPASTEITIDPASTELETDNG